MNYALGKTATMVKPIERVQKGDSGEPKLAPLYDFAVQDTMERFAGAGSPVVTDGEQRKHHNFCRYCVHVLPNTAQAGFMIAFSHGHTRRRSRLTRGPFRYGTQTLAGTVNL